MAFSFTKIYPKLATCAPLVAVLCLACTGLVTASASAQAGFVKNKTGDLPDSSQFYMSRRQIQVVDDSPIVKFGGGGGPSAPGGSGPTPVGGQMALPRAGFQSYTSAAPSITTPLPKVNNGVPPKPTPAEEQAMQAKARSLSRSQERAAAKAAQAAQPKPVEGIKAYNSYKGYNPAASLPIGSAVSAGSASSSTGQVKGSVLHWSRRRHAE